MTYRAWVRVEVEIESGSALRAQELIAEEVASLFSQMGCVEVKATEISVNEPSNGNGFPGPVNSDELMELNRRMVEAVERANPKKEWEGDADSTGGR